MQLPPPARPAMCFYGVEEGAPAEGKLVLVRLHDGTFRFGQVVSGQFAAFDHMSERFVTYPRPHNITHWMEVIPPVPMPVVPAQAEAADEEHEAEFQAAGEAPDRAEDVYA